MAVVEMGFLWLTEWLDANGAASRLVYDEIVERLWAHLVLGTETPSESVSLLPRVALRV